MSPPTIQFNQAQLDSVRRLLGNIGNGEQLAIRRAVQRTTTATKAQVSKELGRKVTLKAAFIKQQIGSRVVEATGRIAIFGSFTQLAAYKTSPSLALSQQYNTNGVSVKVYKDKGAVRMRHAFFAQMENGHIGLFMRAKGADGKRVARLAINELKGPSVSAIYENTPGLSQLVETTAAERLQRELDHQVQYILQNHPRVT